MTQIGHIAAMMGIDADELASRMEYLGLDSKAIELLKELHHEFESSRPKFIENFYDKLLAFEHTRALIPDESSTERLKQAQTKYFNQLTAGNYDTGYMLNRLKIGVVHQQVGLEPKWYFGAFSHYLEGILRQVVQTYHDDPEACHARIHALLKIVFLDMSLALDAYFYADLQEQTRLQGRATEFHAHSKILSEAIQQTADSVIITTPDGEITFVNPAFEQITGYKANEVMGKKPNVVKSGKHDDEFYQQLWATICAGNPFREVFINQRKNGELYYEEKTITPIQNEAGNVTHFISTGKDITERMQAEERFHYLAYHDALTELPNRLLLAERLKQSLTRARWHKRSVALLFLDLDEFKNINDTMGHDVGDRILKLVSERLVEATREGDTVARISGDEFGLLLEDLASNDDIATIVEELLARLAQPFYVDNQPYVLTGSIGISCYPDDGMDFTTLLKHADVAMFRAKELGKNSYQFYSREMSERVFERLNLENNLRGALERNEFILHYQPQIDLNSGRVASVEALIRWQHPELGLISPLKFIPILEETGLIIPVGKWVLSTASKQFTMWQEQGLVLERVSVNLSSSQFDDPDIIDYLQRTMDVHNLERGQLELEITESLLMDTSIAMINKFKNIRQAGIRIAIDDFGTGYSSLNYLKRYPIDVLKIDRSFVVDARNSNDSALVAGAIISLAHALQMEVVAEGVETEEQLAILLEKKCRYIQGYYYSKPLPAHQVERTIKAFKV